MIRNDLTFEFGTERRHLTSDFPKNKIVKFKRYTLIDRHLTIRSIGRFLTWLDFTLRAPNSKLLILVPNANVQLQELLKRIKSVSLNKVFFFSYKWIAGFLTNYKVIKANMEKFFSDTEQSLSASKIRIQYRTYKGLKGLREIPNRMLVIGGNKCRVAVKEAFDASVSVSATCNTDTNFIRMTRIPIYVNHDHIRVKKTILEMVLNRVSKLG